MEPLKSTTTACVCVCHSIAELRVIRDLVILIMSSDRNKSYDSIMNPFPGTPKKKRPKTTTTAPSCDDAIFLSTIVITLLLFAVMSYKKIFISNFHEKNDVSTYGNLFRIYITQFCGENKKRK